MSPILLAVSEPLREGRKPETGHEHIKRSWSVAVGPPVTQRPRKDPCRRNYRDPLCPSSLSSGTRTENRAIPNLGNGILQLNRILHPQTMIEPAKFAKLPVPPNPLAYASSISGLSPVRR